MAIVDDFGAIRARHRELDGDPPLRLSDTAAAARADAGRQHRAAARDPAGWDVICRQPEPEDFGIIDNGDGHIVIPR